MAMNNVGAIAYGAAAVLILVLCARVDKIICGFGASCEAVR
jgi:hypothetical protein